MRCREEGGKHRGKVEIKARTESMDGREAFELVYFVQHTIIIVDLHSSDAL